MPPAPPSYLLDPDRVPPLSDLVRAKEIHDKLIMEALQLV